MRRTLGTIATSVRQAALALAGAGLLIMGLAGCQGGFGGEDPGKAADNRLPAASSGYGAVFLDVRECSSYGKTPREVSCASERAAARVTARYNGQAGSGPSCPATTDFVLHISQSRPTSDETGDGVVPRGYACMRNLTAPHPGDPGGGGGPHTVVGDCVYGAGGGQVKETPCDGSGDRAPEFRVERAVTGRTLCPSTTRLYVQLDGGRPVGCARPV
ncbi:hypothetical protein ACH4SP_21340 [Streptomyces sp. NPDC021093]|uniref:hypothetical protein n=1 Tax=Streptomyces sp. NPDC021093 TaxID=3365112 RepID=UPI00379163C5